MIGCDVAGWLLISTLGRVVVKPDPTVFVTTFWISQFFWGVALAVYFGRRGMVKARGGVLFILGTALVVTATCFGLAVMMTGW